jgi:tetratricopeptide (TPR) repeat protein
MLISMVNLALAYEHLDRLEEARELLVETLATQQRLRGPEHESSLNLGDVYIHGVDFARAEQILSGSLELRRKNVDDDHPETLRTLLNLGNAYRKQRKYHQAEEAIRQVVEARRRLSGPDDPKTRNAMTRLAELYQEMRKPAPHYG